ncbi:Sporulation lipoprotein YhcN/YlaJ (Spore_YhcN_YlaJ) [Thermoflavimicrobium dichotomicum]|uniref:Sporulation lipoprotein YhcN/YlaJ (Spore_YhcN_YlaJ) n=1 Tax=Thermoflavimicrobium dichotomicum TaxID=46223 RepID=A0A1I3LSH6_9BACL|nr:Sporulation lipoprotein YhcN/YlaJ (Spore_YhcN_YlaJ) [Thermoflavimicrobium dichotomicum]
MISFVIFIMSACSPRQATPEQTGNPDEPLYRESNNPSRLGAVRRDNSDINGHESAASGGQNEIGYFRHNPENYRTNGNKVPQPHNVFIDRPILAKHIAQLVTVLPGVKESTVLVTDDHIFVGVRTKNGKHNPKILKEARRTAEAVTPRYYKVHVTDSAKLESQINNVGMRMRTNHDVEGVKGDLENLLRQMGDKTPPDVNENIQPKSKTDIGY